MVPIAKKLLLLVFLSIFYLNTYAGYIYFTNPTNGASMLSPINLQYHRYAASYYIIFTTPETGESWNSRETDIPQWIYRSPGTYTWKLELWEYSGGQGEAFKTDEDVITFSVYYKLYAKNNINA